MNTRDAQETVQSVWFRLFGQSLFTCAHRSRGLSVGEMVRGSRCAAEACDADMILGICMYTQWPKKRTPTMPQNVFRFQGFFLLGAGWKISKFGAFAALQANQRHSHPLRAWCSSGFAL